MSLRSLIPVFLGTTAGVILPCILSPIPSSEPRSIIEQHSVSGVLHPTGLALSQGVIYFSEAVKRRVLFRKETETEFQVFSDDNRFKAPAGISANEQFIFVADPGAHNVFQISLDSRKVTPLLPQDSNLAPSAVVFRPIYDVSNQRLTSHPGLAVLDHNTNRCFLVDLGTTGQTPLLSWSDKSFADAYSITSFERNVFVSDKGAGTLFESPNSQDWSDVRDAVPPPFPFTGAGHFFASFSAPRDAYATSDVIYVVDKRELFAFLRGRNKLVPLAYRPEPLIDPQQVVVSLNSGSILISENSTRGVVSWPLVIPITVEVEATGDTSTPLAALYNYLWNEGVLPTTSVQLPYASPTGELCQTLSCVIERGRSLIPKTNVQIEQTLCSMNPSVCNKDRLSKLRPGQSILIPDVPLESYLSVATLVSDGKSTIGDLIDRSVPDAALRASIDLKFVTLLNVSAHLDVSGVLKKGVSLNLPVQYIRYYLSATREELLSSKSKLAGLIGNFPQLSVRPLGLKVFKGAQSSGQEIILHTPDEIKNAYKNVLSAIDFNTEHSAKYGRANDVPILIAETKADCKHPAFFKNDNSERAFDTPGCDSPEPISDAVVLDWAETEKRHGTCVSSIIGAKAALFGTTIAEGSGLTLSTSGSLDTSALLQMYSESHGAFVVNISSAVEDVGAGSAWGKLLQSPISKYALFIAAAGNENSLLAAKPEYPAFLAEDYPNLVSVGALDKLGTYVWEDPRNNNQGSNTGSKVELLAPGEAIPCATDVIDGKAIYSMAPGTSFAAPIVTAVAALLLDKKLTPVEVKARLLSTAVPLEKERGREPLSRFGRLSIDRALLNLTTSHLEYFQNGSTRQLEFRPLNSSANLNYQNASDPLQGWSPVSFSDVLSLDLMPGRTTDGNLYRLVYFDMNANDKIGMREKVRLSGCFPIAPKGTAEKYLVIFGNACALIGQFDSEHSIFNPKAFIAPRLGLDKF
jgi:hypothetical protein